MRKEGFALGNSSCLKIQGFKRNLSYHLLLLIVIDLFQLRQLFAAYFLYLLVPLLSEGGACGTEVARFLAAKAEFLFNAAFAFFWSELRDLDRVYDHGVRVMGFGVGGGEGRSDGKTSSFFWRCRRRAPIEFGKRWPSCTIRRWSRGRCPWT